LLPHISQVENAAWLPKLTQAGISTGIAFFLMKYRYCNGDTMPFVSPLAAGVAFAQ